MLIAQKHTSNCICEVGGSKDLLADSDGLCISLKT